jgi:hypothetical protein
LSGEQFNQILHLSLFSPPRIWRLPNSIYRVQTRQSCTTVCGGYSNDTNAKTRQLSYSSYRIAYSNNP